MDIPIWMRIMVAVVLLLFLAWYTVAIIMLIWNDWDDNRRKHSK